jgi:hypothetical protein
MFDPTVQSGIVNECGSSARGFAQAGSSAGTRKLRSQCGPLSAAGRDLASGYRGHAAATVSADGHGPAVSSLSC